MSFPRIVLFCSAVVFIAIGLMFLVAPVHWASVVEIPLPTAMARTDLRATYGGFCLAMGGFFVICARRDGWIRPGLVALGLSAAGFGGGRLLGILLEGTASPLMLIFCGLETTTALVAWYLLRRLGSIDKGMAP